MTNAQKHSLIFLLAGVLLTACGSGRKEQEKQLYLIKARGARDTIFKASAACISQANAYRAALEYADVTETDFASAVKEILGNKAVENRARMKDIREKINQLMADLAETPPEFQGVYERLKDFHDVYLRLHDAVVKPSVSGEEFRDTLRDFQVELSTVQIELDNELNKQ